MDGKETESTMTTGTVWQLWWVNMTMGRCILDFLLLFHSMLSLTSWSCCPPSYPRPKRKDHRHEPTYQCHKPFQLCFCVMGLDGQRRHLHILRVKKIIHLFGVISSNFFLVLFMILCTVKFWYLQVHGPIYLWTHLVQLKNWLIFTNLRQSKTRNHP